MKATPIDNMVPVLNAGKLPDGELYLEVTCRDYDHYKALPKAVSMDNVVYGMTGWNSDLCKAYYKNNAKMAFCFRAPTQPACPCARRWRNTSRMFPPSASLRCATYGTRNARQCETRKDGCCHG